MLRPFRACLRNPLTAAWLALALGAAALLALLVQYWGTRPEYADRFLILIGAGWAAWRTRRTLALGRPQLWLAVPLALLAGLLLPVAAFLHTRSQLRPGGPMERQPAKRAGPRC